MEELSALKTELADAKELQVQSDEKYQVLTDRYDTEIQEYKDQVETASYTLSH